MRHFKFNLSPSPACFFDFIIILSFLMWAIFYAMTTTINVPTFHLDGAFQMASGIFRFDSGQFPGKDFFPYLGIGPLFTLYPAFKASGPDIFASVFFAQFMTLISGGLSVSVIWHLMGRSESLPISFAAGAVFFVAWNAPVMASGKGLRIHFEQGRERNCTEAQKLHATVAARQLRKFRRTDGGRAASSTPTGSVCSAF